MVIIALAVIACSCSQDDLEKSRPNVLIINIDDMGWKDVGFMGSSYYETPNIDKLSTAGTIFTNGYASSANCAPSRACLMTGLWTPRHGIYTVGSSERGDTKHRKLIPTKNTRKLARNFKTIPDVLQEAGYKTCHAGKWHLSDNPLEYGFDVNIAGGQNGMPSSYYPPYRNVKIEAGRDSYLTDLIMEKTLAFVDTVSSPFFLYYAPYAVHTPIQPVDSLLKKYETKPGSNGQQNAAYASMVENVDRNIGLLIEKLARKNVMDNTLIVLTSDNGGLYGITKQPPLRAGKGSYYEGGIREPFFFVYKGVINHNATSDVPITNLDIFPTILNYVDLRDSISGLDGIDLSSILEGKGTEPDRQLYWHFPVYLQAYNVADNENRDSLFRTRPGSVVRYGQWKLHYYFEDNETELYNLAQDIGERNNLVQDEPVKANELLGYLEEWWGKTQAPIPTKLNPDYVE